ncbi:MAG: hypothetical protein NTZ77_01880 [Caldiserica bacterium]|nr:hypothetical protein [Caldisericota bacterium]
MQHAIETSAQGTTQQSTEPEEQTGTPSDARSILVVHSASGHSGKTTICRSLVRDLPFDAYIKLSRHSLHLATHSLAAGTLPLEGGDTGRLSQSERSPWLRPLRDIILLDGPHQETEDAVALTIRQWPVDTRVLIEGNCSSVPDRSRSMYVLRCPLLQSAKTNMSIMAARADLLVVNRFPGCTEPEEAALLAILRDWNPRATEVSGSVEDTTFIETVEAAVLDLFPLLRST